MKRIASLKNARVKEWKKLKTKKGREKAGAFIIDGPHLVEEAILNRAAVTDLIFGESFQIPENWEIGHLTHWVVTDAVISNLADTETPQGVIAIVQMKPSSLVLESKGTYLLLDRIQDPGNLGTIIRTADSAGVNGVILGGGTVDLYNSKVLRSTQGSIFHLPIVTGSLEEWIPRLQKEGINVFGTALHGGTPYTLESIPESYALLLGNEANGVQNELLAMTNRKLYVPIFGKAESLNVAVAAGILLYGLKPNALFEKKLQDK